MITCPLIERVNCTGFYSEQTGTATGDPREILDAARDCCQVIDERRMTIND